MNSDYKRVAFVLIASLLSAVILMAAVIAASAHEAPSGWKYDQDCCSNQDCSIVKAVKYNDNGTMEVTSTIDNVDYTINVDLADIQKRSPWKIRPSKDEYMHICLYVKAGPPTTPICIYLPAGT